MRYLSLFSGIEAASVAWKPLGWTCVAVAEVEPFPCAVLAHHYPDVPNLGDVTKITQQQIEALGHIDIVIYGFPCQDLSIAGARKGLTNADGTTTRSGLFFVAAQIVEWSKARWAIAENVPGLFSSNEGRDFAAVVGELAGTSLDVPGEGWRTAGVALGERGLVEWFVLDAQFVRVASHRRAVPQRRRRVFIVRDTGDWSDRPPFLLISEGLCGHPPPRRGPRQDVAGTLGARTGAGGGLGTDFELSGGQTASVAGCLNSVSGHAVPGNSIQDADQGYQIPQCAAVAHDGVCHQSKGGDPTTDNYVTDVARRLLAKGNDSHAADLDTYVAHALTANGFDASEDGTGVRTDGSAYTLEARAEVQAICFNARQDPDVSGGVCGPLDTDGSTQAIAFALRGREEGAVPEVHEDGSSVGALRATSGGSSRDYIAFDTTQITSKTNRSQPKAGDPCHTLPSEGHAPAVAVKVTRWMVRRITPEEAEALQGFPRGYTKIDWSGWRDMDATETPEQCVADGMEVRQTNKTSKWRVKDADGPRYRALGNSMAVNCMAWIGQRVEELAAYAK